MFANGLHKALDISYELKGSTTNNKLINKPQLYCTEHFILIQNLTSVNKDKHVKLGFFVPCAISKKITENQKPKTKTKT